MSNRTDIVLIRPPGIMGQEHSTAVQHPINLCYLAASAIREGMTAAILDYEVTPYTPAGFAGTLRDLRPAVIGITSMTPTICAAGALAAIARDACPQATIVLGGPHVSILPLETLQRYPDIDSVIIGEGEHAFAQLCSRVAGGGDARQPIPSVMSRTPDGEIIDPPSMQPPVLLDALPLPARHLLDLPRYRGAPTPGISASMLESTQLFTARGCPGHCIFCCSEAVFGRNVRTRSVASVITEIADCANRFGFRHFTIDNDTFTYSRRDVLAFCTAVAPLRVTWDCDTRVDRVDAELIAAMAASGCRKIAFGVETGSPEILRLIKKGITIDQVRNAFALARKARVMSCAFLMVGNHPEESHADIAMTEKLIREIKPDLISVAIATPYPGSGLESEMLLHGTLSQRLPWDSFGGSFHGSLSYGTLHLSPGELMEAQARMLRRFYLRPGYILRRLMSIRSAADAMYWLRSGMGFIKYLCERITDRNAGGGNHPIPPALAPNPPE